MEEFKCLQCLEGMHCPLKHNKTRHQHMLLLFSAAVAPLPNVKAPHATEALNSMQAASGNCETGLDGAARRYGSGAASPRQSLDITQTPKQKRISTLCCYLSLGILNPSSHKPIIAKVWHPTSIDWVSGPCSTQPISNQILFDVARTTNAARMWPHYVIQLTETTLKYIHICV